MPGFGSQPFGSSPYGIGTPAVAVGPSGKILADPKTGEQSGSRRIDPTTKDYDIGSSGRVTGMPDIQQLVTLALSTINKSSAMRSLGHSLPSVKVVTAGIAQDVRHIVENALANLIAQKRITLNDVRTVRVRPDAHVIRVFWTDLSSGREYRQDA